MSEIIKTKKNNNKITKIIAILCIVVLLASICLFVSEGIFSEKIHKKTDKPSAIKFREFYSENSFSKQLYSNEYTGIMEDMNVIFVHMESIQNYLVDMEINGVEITPTINRLSKEGMYFDNFYAQVSVGNCSDTEFTLNTSLMPALSDIVFVNYYDRDYISIPKLLSEKGYYTFSSYGNAASLWKRKIMHPNLGYQEMIFKDKFDVNSENTVGLGLSDVAFFEQLQSELEKIEDEHDKYMGTLIQLSNHFPYANTDVNPELYDYFGKLDLTNTYTKNNGYTETKVDDYLDGTKLGNYLISAHYGDMALGTFIEYVENSEYFENTVFVFYGDHDAKIDKSEYQYLKNYNTKTGEEYKPNDSEYVEYDNIDHEINKKTPLIIWTKNEEVRKKINIVNHNVMGMYDVMPTIGNMMGFYNPYSLGHDIFQIGEDNIVIFPNGNFITNTIYYDDESANFRIISIVDEIDNIDNKYIDELKDYAERIIYVSNKIIVHDLIKKEGKNVVFKDEK